MNFLDAAVLRDGGDVIEVEVAGFGRDEVKKPAGARFNGSGITIGARAERMTLLVGADAQPNRVATGTVVGASKYGVLTNYAFAIPAAYRPAGGPIANTRYGRHPLPDQD